MGTLDYFKGEFVAFYELLGKTSFWALPDEQRRGALTGLLHATKDVTDDPTNSIAHMIELAVNEYARREILLLTERA